MGRQLMLSTSCLQMLQQGFEANASDYDGRQAQLLTALLQPLHLPGQWHCLPKCRADELDPPARLLRVSFCQSCFCMLPGASVWLQHGLHGVGTALAVSNRPVAPLEACLVLQQGVAKALCTSALLPCLYA